MVYTWEGVHILSAKYTKYWYDAQVVGLYVGSNPVQPMVLAAKLERGLHDCATAPSEYQYCRGDEIGCIEETYV